MKKFKPKSKAKLFDPDDISTKISQALHRDHSAFTLAYKGNDHIMLNAFNRQDTELLKKFCPQDLDVDTLSQITYDKFIAVNDHMLNYNIKHSMLDIDDSLCFQGQSINIKILKRVKSLLFNVLGDLDEEEFFEECKNSSGTTIGVPFRDTSDSRKFRYPMSATRNVVPLFQRYLLWDSHLRSAIHELNSDSALAERYNVVKGSRATTVDKTASSRRMICVEPTCNMFLQLGLMRVLYSRMDKVGLDVSSLPDRHKKIARESSITSKFATIDWSSASDCVSIELLRKVLPCRWFALIDQLRCPATNLNGEWLELQMVSSMGNAGTFPLETLVFWAFAVATQFTIQNTSPTRLIPLDKAQEVSVFGDDCIVLTSIAECYISVMESVGFIINKEKSFYGTEQFRESCGGDYLHGYDNRPYFLKAPVSNRLSALEPWLYIIANSLFRKYFMYFGETSYFYEKRVFAYLFGLFKRYNISLKLVPSYFPDDSGLKMSHDIHRLRTHYSFELERVSVSTHGTYSFLYCSFKYRRELTHFDDIVYWRWLKKPSLSPRKTIGKVRSHVGPDRKVGGYVVAKGISCHWQVPTVT